MSTNYPSLCDTDTCLASLIQRQFWVLHSFAPGSSAYNIPLVSVIKGAIDIEALETALNTLLRKYRIFRAAFEISDSGELRQRFAPWSKRPLQPEDLRASRNGDVDNPALEQALDEEVRAPFDMAGGPLLRFKLFRVGERLHVLSITVHHIIFDLATSDLFAGELARAYSAALKGHPTYESIETAEYAQYCVWEERWLKSDERKKMEAGWMRYLEGAEPSLKLPSNRPLKNDSLSAGAIVPVPLPRDLSERIHVFCRKESSIPFLVLLTAWSLTLAELSSQGKLTVGVPLTNRRKDEFKKTMGCFVNILPLVLDLSGNPTKIEMLRRVRMALLKMHRMQEIPYYHLVQMARHAGLTHSRQLFQVGFTFENPMQLELEGLVVTPKYVHHGGAQLDLFGKFWQEADALTGVIEYDRIRFETSFVKRISEKFLAMINEICSERQGEAGVGKSETSLNTEVMPVPELPPLSDQERHRLIVEWNDTRADYPINACLHQLFEEQANRTPEAIAVEFEDQRLTYSELDARSRQLAQYLRELGVEPDVLVAVYMDRSLEMGIALLGILKAGGAYMPLDRVFPRDRLACMLEDAKPLVLVTLTSLRGEIPLYHPTVVCVDDFPHAAEKRLLSAQPTPDNLAYVLYTSGSTGKSKGVEIMHRAVVNFLTSMRKEPGMNSHDTLLSVTTISFDIFGLELWLPLTTGAKVIIVPYKMIMDGKLLAKLIAGYNVTMMQATPAIWRLLLESGWEGKADLKILCGGESWSQELADSLLSRCASLWNMYGPTETTIWSAVCQIQDGEPILLGRPIANTQFYVVDSQLQLLPAGTPGELLIGGVGLARGYLNQPELTAEKFISDHINGNKGARLYRTGDNVRYMPDGKLEFIGRLDRQVKIRGFRIELGDIESVLCAIPGIKQAAVVVHEDKSEKYLVAHVVPIKEFLQTVNELRAYLKHKLPHYMIPERFIILPAMPLTPNGKVDRKSLFMPKKAQLTEAEVVSCEEVYPKIPEWNETDRAYPLDKCLQSFIEEQVIKTPDAPALTFEDKTLSYREMNKRVNQLAHFLQAKGVGPETLVGVCAFRSMEMVIALLAIIKAGGAYVPFDPTYPIKRIAFMIDDSKVPVILAQKTCGTILEKTAAKIIFFEEIASELEGYPTDNPLMTTRPENLAYVIYTSGSTGNPKGAMITHKGIVNRLLWMQDTFPIGLGDALLQKTPFSFDVSVWEFFWPFMCGARLVVAKPEGHKDADYLQYLIQKEKISVIHFVPSMLRLFLDKADQTRCASLKFVVSSGEALTTDLQKKYFTILKAPLYNLYGPTEAAVDVSYWKCDPRAQGHVVPIGRPISNTKLYILDENRRSVPVGESGELYIGGVQVARGYLNRPELTAEKFISNPFSDDFADRLYKTGDLCRYLTDGAIEYLGRVDFQVKIRGNRIEPGEIEAAILRDSSVKDCVVIAREDESGEQRLAAYVVENGDGFSASTMRERLSSELPDYMIPAHFVSVPSFPLSPSGKIDRLALPTPGHKRPKLVNRYVAPQGETERLMVKIWQDILKIETVGLDDNFFDLGGHSLLLARMANILQKSFNKDISVMDLFERPTVRTQARFICSADGGNISIEHGIRTQPQTQQKRNGDWEEGEI